MKCSLLTCKECTYETQDQSFLNIHKLLMHSRWKSAKDERYPCPQEGCEFQSQYKANFRRHLLNIHKFKLSDLIDVDAATTTAKETGERHFFTIFYFRIIITRTRCCFGFKSGNSSYSLLALEWSAVSTSPIALIFLMSYTGCPK